MNFLNAELAHAGEETTLSPGMLLLEQLRITPERDLPPMEFLFRLFGKPCFPRRELVAITGKAKSGKTYVTSMLTAKSVVAAPSATGGAGGSPQTGRMPSLQRTRDAPLKVLWYDTEQSDESTQDILRNRIIPMTTAPADAAAPLPLWKESGIGEASVCDAFNVRSVEWQQRRELLTEAVIRCKPDLVIVDGIRDLVNDINDGVLAQEVLEELMHLATVRDCCIVCVLHQNKGGEDRNLRGWVGTELMNKAFEVYTCEKLMPQRIFKLEQTLTRKYDIEQSMYFTVEQDGLPSECAVPAVSEGTAGYGGDRERLPQLNAEYIVHGDDGGDWQFDVARLFLDAMRGEPEVGGKELRQRVMQLSGVVVPFMYNRLLCQALEQQVIGKTMREGRTVYTPAPF